MKKSFKVKLTGIWDKFVILHFLHDVKYVNNLFQTQFQRKLLFELQ